VTIFVKQNKEHIFALPVRLDKSGSAASISSSKRGVAAGDVRN
jgi:hypothetical protein